MKFVYDDGGRLEAGFKGTAGDCAVRAVAIATGIPYREVYDRLNEIQRGYIEECTRTYEKTKSQRVRAYYSGVVSNSSPSVRNGTYAETLHRFFSELGWKWTATMKFGSGCQVHLRDSELPRGKIVCRMARHFAAVINGVLHDTWDSQEDGSRCVYGYWSRG